ncbi:MAG: carboxylating nicotinate-nucleotide diphosphorylase [Coriobacteriales bacterium]|nr:carboxylating nicotinate-nucleotide diphosphorylase [Coriobacteriales bacterium]
MFTLPEVRDIVASALAEDLGVPASRFASDAAPDPKILDRDVTSSSVLAPSVQLTGHIVARESLVVAGLPVVDAVYRALAQAAGDPDAIEVFPLVAEGAQVDAGTPVAEIDGSAQLALAGERTALNFLMLLCGIASEARRWQEAAGERMTVVDTRKTYPGLRALSKYATVVGGAKNHRRGLWDMVLVKDNHLRRVSLAEAIRLAREKAPGVPIEVEADTLEQAVETVRAGADLVLLDNMNDERLGEAVDAVRAEADARGVAILAEASGGITIDRVYTLRRLGLDRLSTSAITFARPRDLALDVEWTA